jgi:hypothetical protein
MKACLAQKVPIKNKIQQILNMKLIGKNFKLSLNEIFILKFFNKKNLTPKNQNKILNLIQNYLKTLKNKTKNRKKLFRFNIKKMKKLINFKVSMLKNNKNQTKEF